MSGKGPNSGKSAVEAHYSAHPYPKADAIDTMALRREELNTLAGRWSQPIPRDKQQKIVFFVLFCVWCEFRCI